jgi:N-acyl homoserine lactone hydrolase
MNLRNWALLAGAIPVAIGAGLVARALLPEQWPVPIDADDAPAEGPQNTANLPSVEVMFLRCGVTQVPELVAIRGGSLKRVAIAHSAVLVRHPAATFLYDTGMCGEIQSYLARQSFMFRQTLGRFAFERSLGAHLADLGLAASNIDFALLSHLHWDHVSGVPDLPGVRLRINRVEYEAAQRGLLDANQGLVRELMRDNPIDLFDYTDPAYEGFSSSYDLFGDGALVLAPLPGHTAGNTGLFINRSNGPRFLLIGDAAHVAANYIRPATMHPVLWSAVTSDDAAARRTLLALHRFSRRRPEVMLIAMHDAATQARVEALHARLA